MIQKISNCHGFSLLEALIAIVIISVGILGLGKLQISAMKSSTVAQSRAVANAIAQSQLDTLRTISIDDALLLDTDGNGNLDDGYVTNSDPVLGNADHSIAGVAGSNGETFQVFWNIVEESPVQDTRTVRMFVWWRDQRFGPSKVILTSVLARDFYL